MDRNKFSPAIPGTTPFPILPRQTLPSPTNACVYVRVDAANIVVLKFVGCFDIPIGTTANVMLYIYDSRTRTFVLRIAYHGDGITPFTAPTSLTLTTAIQIP